jgi:proteasome accessory factor PafA2
MCRAGLLDYCGGMQRVFGIETEYGITVDGAENLDVVHESIAIVRSFTERGASMKWDYALEDPHRDTRGFRVAELLQDTDEAAYFEVDRQRPLSFTEIKSDLVLANGARFYNDHAHPEYSTPECNTLAGIVAHDRAGERVLAECARRRNRHLPEGKQVRLFKNNTDFVGHSYGCHDNYLMRRDVHWNDVVAAMTPFLVTRQIFAGAGKLGVEVENGVGDPGVFQISQRSDFFSVLVSIDTMNRRPLVNTRDEPHADEHRFRRFHVIIGDANRSEWATAMKIGTTALVLELIERGEWPRIELADPVFAVKQISRDAKHRWCVERKSGGSISAADIQRLFLDAASRVCDREDPDVAWILREWETVLDDLERDPSVCANRVDWAAKRFLLETMREGEGLEWDDPWLQSIDLQYHDVGGADLFRDLEESGQMMRVVSEDRIVRAMTDPPGETRAYFRGRAVAKFHDAIESIQWNEVVLKEDGKTLRVVLDEAGPSPRVMNLNRAITTAANIRELAAAIESGQ